MKLRFPIRLLKYIEHVQHDIQETLEIEQIEESLTPNMRALRLAMSMTDQLASMGVAASDAVHMCLGITNTYCKRKVHIDISSTLITVSQDRGNNREPLTLVRTIDFRDTDYKRVQSLQSLALKIRDHKIQLEDAEKEFDKIVREPKPYPRWLRHIMAAGISAGVVILYAGTPLMVFLAFLMGIMASWLIDFLSRKGLASFYIQILVSLCMTLIATLTVWLNIQFSLNMNPTLMLIGGIVMLMAGMMIVGAFQDAIDEYYVTANARLLRVIVSTGGVVIGVLTGLFVASKFGISFPATPDRLPLADESLRYLGAFIIASGFAASKYAPRLTFLMSGLAGFLSYFILQLMMDLNLGVVVSSGIAATVVGLLATFGSRFWHFPSVAIISAAIVPLVPGLAFYNGLMGISGNATGSPEFMMGLTILMRAVAIGVAVAAGATLGNMIGRPLRRQVVELSNKLPKRRLSPKSK